MDPGVARGCRVCVSVGVKLEVVGRVFGRGGGAGDVGVA